MALAAESTTFAPMVRSRTAMPQPAVRSRTAMFFEAEDEATCSSPEPMVETRTAVPVPPPFARSRDSMLPDVADEAREDDALSACISGRASAPQGSCSLSSRSTTADGSVSEEAVAEQPRRDWRPRAGSSCMSERQRTAMWSGCMGIKVDAEENHVHRGETTVVGALRRAGERLRGRRD
eukprot:CAMPEP_0170274682 /NCGR_PEP_ID=MMETSP0116_2-20130129/37316_1 /TAXON_ID=400756 /ORGANISM="Durinskia baltica, Strain CSIRO CS-38" /LENGTH=178 /DNA_ID=CAMNT_0010525935 /DNA_START=48 /DNA_END=584 /DNA_ORIENTATION=+